MGEPTAAALIYPAFPPESVEISTSMNPLLRTPLSLAVALALSAPVFATDAPSSAGPGPALVRLADGDHYHLRAAPLRWHIGAAEVDGFAYNGSVPGPLLVLPQGATVTIDFDNAITQPTTVHWHGLRLDYRNDGVPGVGQPAVAPGGSARYVIHAPDAGLYWYHPHVREDAQQDAGLYGNLWVVPRDASYWRPVAQEAVLMLDDIMLRDGHALPAGEHVADHALMGRFGNQLLVNGASDWTLQAQAGQTVRFWLTNVANVRPFRLDFGVPLRLVGGDNGRIGSEREIPSVDIAPAERMIVEARFDHPGRYELANATPEGRSVLGHIEVAAAPDTAADNSLRQNREVLDEAAALRARYADTPPDKTLQFDLRIDPANGDHAAMGHTTTADAGMDHSTMNHETTSGAMAEMDHAAMGHGGDAAAPAAMDHSTMNHDTTSGAMAEMDHAAMDHGHGGHAMQAVEWEDGMGVMNAASTSANTHWILRDLATGQENMAIHWQFQRGQPVKIRLVNPADGVHPMQHPIHFHGQRFLVLAVDGKAPADTQWKDTVQVAAGSTVDILLDNSNPGEWMAHCHIGEHLTSGMMLGFSVSS